MSIKGSPIYLLERSRPQQMEEKSHRGIIIYNGSENFLFLESTSANIDVHGKSVRIEILSFTIVGGEREK